MKAALWLRVSDPSVQTVENQRPELEAWAQRLGMEVTKVYQVEGSAWKGAHRKLLAEAQSDARRGLFSVLLVWALDRLSREGIVATLEAVHGFERQGCQVWSLQQSWTQQPESRMHDLLLSLYGWIAQEESHVRSERTKAGLARLKAQGRTLGRPVGSKDGHQRKRSGYARRG